MRLTNDGSLMLRAGRYAIGVAAGYLIVGFLMVGLLMNSGTAWAQVWLPPKNDYIGIKPVDGSPVSQQAAPIQLLVEPRRIYALLQGEQALGVFRRSDLAPLSRWPIAGRPFHFLKGGNGWLVFDETKAALALLHPKSGVVSAQIPLEQAPKMVAVDTVSNTAAYVSKDGQKIWFINLDTSEIIGQINGPSSGDVIALNDGATQVAVADKSGGLIRFYERSSGAETASTESCQNIKAMDFNAPGILAILCEGGTQLVGFDTTTDTAPKALAPVFDKAYHGFLRAPRDGYLFLLPENGDRIDVLALGAQEIIHSIQAGEGPHRCVIQDKALYCVAKKSALLTQQALPPQLLEE